MSGQRAVPRRYAVTALLSLAIGAATLPASSAPHAPASCPGSVWTGLGSRPCQSPLGHRGECVP